MNEDRPMEAWEQRLRETAGAFQYPPTPDIAATVRTRLRRAPRPEGTRLSPAHPRQGWQLAWAAAVMGIFLVSLLLVPDVRAGIRSALRLGAITLVFPTPVPVTSEPLPSPAPVAPLETPMVLPAERPVETLTASPARTPRPSPTPWTSILNLAGETSLAAAQQAVLFPIKLPTYPAELGPPDRVFVQDLGGPAVILVWLVPGHEDQVQLSLHQLSTTVFGEKELPERTIVRETTVDGRPALWVRGLHMLRFKDPGGNINLDIGRLVDGNVLIWEDEAGITYRIETELPLEETQRIAESLR